MDTTPIKPLSIISRARPHIEAWGVRLVAVLTWLMGAVNLLSALRPAMMSRLVLIRDTVPLEVRAGSRLTIALAGFALFLLAGGLWRRKRTAWLVTVLLLTVSVVTHLLKGLDYEDASLTVGLIVVLLLLRPSFHAYSDPPSLRQGLAVLLAAFVFTLVYGTAGFALAARHGRHHLSLLGALHQTASMIPSFYNPGPLAVSGFGRYFAPSIYIVGIVTLGYALIMLVRPVLVRQPSSADERKHAAEIITHHGQTALARPALFEDKSYFFSQGGSVIAYVVRGRGAMALGDPIGPAGDCQAAIAAFRSHCAKNDWQPAFLAVQPDFIDLYRAAGFDILCLGYEAIVPLDSFSLEGSQIKPVRNAYNKLIRLGYQARLYSPPLDDRLLRELRLISDDWLTTRHGLEMHFSVGWFDEAYLRSTPVMAVRAPDGGVTAFANLVSEYCKNELSIDLMRRTFPVESGTMEFLFVSMLQWAKEKGYHTFSLGVSPIFGRQKEPDDPRITQALYTIAEYVNRLYNFKGLHSFKEQFHPRWEPRYLAYPGTASLPLVLTTLLRVHTEGNFLWKYIRN